ncbi:MAG: hypothetical protein GX811_06245 [Lentisphaerae bacterium]|nr:hypothetical protein [Lentisphaerota bacterium]
MKLREAPFLLLGKSLHEPLFSPRMVHSGWGIDMFPDSHLKAIAHTGMDAILVYVKDIDKSSYGYCDFNDLARRAGEYGLDVYLYSYIFSSKHPDDPEAEESYESTYGHIVAACPGVKGIVLVGESVQFPSKDERAAQIRPRIEGDKRPLPGWWPCRDYPDWLDVIKRVIRKHSPDFDIVFWTYNWGWAPEKERVDLIKTLPTDISLLATFEMFEEYERGNAKLKCADYTLAFEGPGVYFRSEAEAAHERGIPLYTMSNTGGLTWDVGVIPYLPCPYQWKRRWDALRKAHANWNLSGLMESHHYGWAPSFINELAREAFWTGGMDFDTHIKKIAERDFGKNVADDVIEAWKLWSEAIRYTVPTANDQYGAFRTGPAYPLRFMKEEYMPPATPHARNGAYVFNVYKFPIVSQLERLQTHIENLTHMEDLMHKGIDLISNALEHTPEHKKTNAARMVALGKFIANTVQTCIHTKQWFIQNNILLDETATVEEKLIALDEMEIIGKRELENARATIPLTLGDSRLGWEPTMDYQCGPEHLHWKISNLEEVVEKKIPEQREVLRSESSAEG